METTKISIRLSDKSLAQVDSFASAHSMNRTAAIEFFVRLATHEIQKNDAEGERFDRLESALELIKTNLKASQKANYKAMVYLCLGTAHDQKRMDESEQISIKTIGEIFDKTS